VSTLGRQFLALQRVEWLNLWRAPTTFLATAFFALLMVVVFYFSIPMGMGDARLLVPYIVWLVVLFGGILQCNRSFDLERDQDVLEGIRLIPGLPSLVFLSKWCFNLGMMVLLWAMVVVMAVVFFNFPITMITPSFLLPVLLGIIGLVSVGTLIAGMVRGHHKRDIYLPILVFPVLLPLALAVVRWYAAMENFEGMWEAPWGHLLVGFDLIFTAAAGMLFPVVLDE
jgi:heme exporter protein B